MQYVLNGVRYAHCGDDFWRILDKNGYIVDWNQRFVNRIAVEHYIEWRKDGNVD